MTRDELVAHCKRKIAECERWAAIKGEEISGDKVYDEHRFILTMLTQPREHEISLADAIGFAEQGDSQEHEHVEKLVKPEPFINKLCVSEQACHEDKMKVLEKIKAEIYKFVENPDFGDLSLGASCGAMKAIEIIDKYRAESER